MNRYRTVTPGKPAIFDGRWYVGLRERGVIVLRQPRRGFATEGEAEAFLAGWCQMDFLEGRRYEVVEAARIDDVMYERLA